MGGLPSKQMVSRVDGQAQARTVSVGDRLWTLVGSRTEQTVVTAVTAVKARDVVDVVTDQQTFCVAPDQLLWPPLRGTGTGAPGGAALS